MAYVLFVIILIAAGFFAMMGFGGGIIYVPILSWYGLDYKTGVIPLSLLLSAATGMTATYTYLRARLVNVSIGTAAVSTALVGAPLGAYCVRFIPTGIIKVLFAIVALYAAVRILKSSEPDDSRRVDPGRALQLGLLIGIIVGFSSGLLGIGNGFLVFPFFMAIGCTTKESAATTALVITFSAFFALILHLRWATFDPKLAAALVVAVVIGSRMGGLWTSTRARPQTLRMIVGIIILVIAARMGWEGLSSF